MSWSNVTFTRCLLILLLCPVCIGLQSHAIGQSKPGTDQPDPAADLVSQALQAEVEGRTAERAKLLQQAVAVSPDYAAARWHLGQVKIGDVWMSPDDVSTAALNNPALSQYIEMRQAYARVATWIWFPTQGNNPMSYLRKTFDLPSKPVRAELMIGTQADYELFLNGKRIGGGKSGDKLAKFQVATKLRQGPNTIAIQVRPLGRAGVLVWVEGTQKNNSIFTVASDETWKGSWLEQKKWNAPEFNDDDWNSAPEYVPVTYSSVTGSSVAESNPLPSPLPSISVELEESLANWCDEQQLAPQARFHWSRLLLANPNHLEAMKALGLKRFREELMTQQQIEERKAEEVAVQKAKVRWGRVLETARSQLANPKSAKEELLARKRMDEIVDSDAIPVIRLLLVNNSQQPNVGFAKASIAALGRMDFPNSSEAIVEAVYYHPDTAVASEAAKALANRDLMSFIPALMSRFEAPTEFTSKIESSSETRERTETKKRTVKHKDGEEKEETERIKVTYTYSTYVVKATIKKPVPEGDSIESKTETHQEVTRSESSGPSKGLVYGKIQARLAQTKSEIEAANLPIEFHNRGLGTLLEELTNQKLGTHPRPWWDWWKAHNELNYSSNPVRVVSWWNQIHKSQQINQSAGPPRECFVRGTPVWTRRGMVPIETVMEGDDVLSQDPRTGELAYKLVMSVATRPATPLSRVVVGRDTIVTTPGHRLWVAGQGWRMAKQVAEGDSLHTLNGSLPVSSIAAVDPEPSHNLTVEDFHTFFVGREKILVHDAGAPEPTDRLVPGLPRAAVGK